ncbi:MAG: hypothetical protein KAG53_09590 [Endozoicomonadaceae bacterium]|nr:hypothetical protein [Endozoicomonadaceae bacterium]
MNSNFVIQKFIPVYLNGKEGVSRDISSKKDIPDNSKGVIRATFEGISVSIRVLSTNTFKKYMSSESREKSFSEPSALNDKYLQDNKKKLAKNGFYYVNVNVGWHQHHARVKCVICSSSLIGLSANHEIEIEHQSRCKECQGILNGNTFDFCFPMSHCEMAIISTSEFDQIEHMTRAIRMKVPCMINTLSVFLINKFIPINIDTGARIGFPTDILNKNDIPNDSEGEIQATFEGKDVTLTVRSSSTFKQYMTSESREQSFFDSVALTQKYLQKNKKKLSENGFFYKSTNDVSHQDGVECVVCSGKLNAWCVDDEPDNKHEMFYGACPGVLNRSTFSFAFLELFQHDENMASASRMGVDHNERSNIASIRSDEFFNLFQAVAASVRTADRSGILL